MKFTKCFEFNGKCYVGASDYEESINQLMQAKEEIKSLKAELVIKENLLEIKNGLRGENDLSGLSPIEVAEKLIYTQSEYETNSIERAFGKGEKENTNIFSISDLRQIAGHLLVYCNHNSERDD